MSKAPREVPKKAPDASDQNAAAAAEHLQRDSRADSTITTAKTREVPKAPERPADLIANSTQIQANFASALALADRLPPDKLKAALESFKDNPKEPTNALIAAAFEKRLATV